MKFTTNGTIEIGSKDKGNEIVFFVKDTGIGIPENRLEAVFDRFVQADLTLSRSHEGFGLGLSIAKAYAMPSDRSKLLEIGCNDYISKPIVTDSLLKLLQKHVNPSG